MSYGIDCRLHLISFWKLESQELDSRQHSLDSTIERITNDPKRYGWDDTVLHTPPVFVP